MLPADPSLFDMNDRRLAGTAAAIAAVLFCSGPVRAQQDPAAQRGLTFVKTHCAQCHAIGSADESPLRQAVPLRTIHRMYPPEHLPEAMVAGVRKGHPNMPAFLLDIAQYADVIAYLKQFAR